MTAAERARALQRRREENVIRFRVLDSADRMNRTVTNAPVSGDDLARFRHLLRRLLGAAERVETVTITVDPDRFNKVARGGIKPPTIDDGLVNGPGGQRLLPHKDVSVNPSYGPGVG